MITSFPSGVAVSSTPGFKHAQHNEPPADLYTGTPRARSSLGLTAVTCCCRSCLSAVQRCGRQSCTATSRASAAYSGAPYQTCQQAGQVHNNAKQFESTMTSFKHQEQLHQSGSFSNENSPNKAAQKKREGGLCNNSVWHPQAAVDS